MQQFHGSLTDLYLNRSWFNRVSPAASAACIAAILAILVLVANRRRIVNRIWALELFFLGLWQASIAAAQLFENFAYVRCAVSFAGLAAASTLLLKDVILVPEKRFRKQLQTTRFIWMVLPLYVVAIVAPFSLQLTSRTGDPGLMYWVVTLLSIGVAGFVLGSTLEVLWRKKVAGFAARELRALAGLTCTCFVAALVSVIFGRLAQAHYVRWLSSSILILGFLLFTTNLIRSEIIDVDGPRERVFLLCVRGIGCFLIGFFFILCVSISGVGSPVVAMVYSAVLGIVLVGLPIVDRQFRGLLDRRFVSLGFRDAQSAINLETERNVPFAELHAAYCEVLRRWANGSQEVFLSEGVFSVGWPSAEIPAGLARIVFEEGWITPEIFGRLGTATDDPQRYLAEQKVSALVGCVSRRGERLLAMFSVRKSGKAFSSRELREARELLRQMQIGLGFARIRQAQRSDDRLNFYGQYAPQFAHEIRNGLYLQTQLLRAIANGRGETVLASDAKVGLQKVEQLDRLCEHFFRVGAVFKQPVRALNLCGTLQGILEKERPHIRATSGAEVELQMIASDDVEVLANPDMLGIAMQNLLTNSAEALAGADGPRRIEVVATMQFGRVRVLVRDDGPGMPADRSHDPFSPGLSHKKGGMGLGLSIVRDCIEAMGGTIGLRPPDGHGACFEITLVCPSPGRSDSPLHRSFSPSGQNPAQPA